MLKIEKKTLTRFLFLKHATDSSIIFRVDASRAGEGQLEISINDGDVPNAVQVLGGGKCLVTYTPEEAITHEIEVTFNDEQVPGETTSNSISFITRISYRGWVFFQAHPSFAV